MKDGKTIWLQPKAEGILKCEADGTPIRMVETWRFNPDCAKPLHYGVCRLRRGHDGKCSRTPPGDVKEVRHG